MDNTNFQNLCIINVNEPIYYIATCHNIIIRDIKYTHFHKLINYQLIQNNFFRYAVSL